MAKIKICGLQERADVLAANRLLPDYVGFVFAKSKRQITKKQASVLRELLTDKIPAVGVFVNDEILNILELCNSGVIQMIQLHGDEDQEYIESLKTKTDCPVIKALQVQNREQILEADRVLCDYLLLDAYAPDLYGGSGRCFDWSLVPKLSKSFFLAGGLNEENIEQAKRSCSPFCLDVSSGVETDGKKDPDKIKRIIEKVRAL